MSWIGLAMFVLAMALMIATGLPVYAVLLGIASVGAALGVALGAFEWQILGALPARIVGLLEHDLLQALPLYALIGALLNRLPIAELLHGAGERLFARSGAAAEMSALGVGALLAPMNGSVGASLHALSQRVAPALAARGVAPAEATATVCVASTLGIVIPPSLVLLLLGDAMMRAHTEAANTAHLAIQIVNTQDVVRAALLPGLLVFLAALAIAAWRARGRRAPPAPPLGRGALVRAALIAAAIALLLAAVASGRLYAVEASATGAVGLTVWAVATRRLDRAALRGVLADAMVLTGVLMALLVAATSFSLVLRALGTDLLVADGLQKLAAEPRLLLGAVLGGFVLCSFVLDAFEMIFLVVPIVMPPLLVAVPDAAWVAALTLVVLQTGFLLPPLGYAVVMSRRTMARPPALAALARALLPQLVAQAVIVAALISWPQLVHWGDAAPPSAAPAPSELDLERMFDEASRRDAKP
ncbi:MAG TPA: TRAP transporter large permease subunit [Caldimonas sp.]|jgi:TRAP-type mannitol/chloroaromatic compound transport system permease large subunit|nr:TRAP transporter large permease subunit [Caldimonas sp.]HEX4234248.1 TRAP transporter large permease subunit [Caldimonas sp.]